jgi:voltage-gated potassium channel
MAAANPTKAPGHGEAVWQVVMLLLCAYVLGVLLAESFFRVPPETALLLNRVDSVVCVLFLGDFAYHLARAPRPLAYLKWGWIDLISAIPNLQILRWGRFARVVRILRLLRGFRSLPVVMRMLFANRAQGTLASVATLSFFLVVFASVAILNCETTPEANIRTASDALWWSLTTITTVGYGDRYPVTTLGRIVAVVLMTAGVGLFGTFTAYVASTFVQQEGHEAAPRDDATSAQLRDLAARLDRIERLLSAERRD